MSAGVGTQKVRCALDWTANTAHAALLVAAGHSFFAAEGLEVEFVEPTMDGAPETPLKGLLDGSVTFGIVPCDDVLLEHLGKDRVCCVATTCHVDISTVAVLESSKITKVELLAGAKYGSCGYPLEVACLNSMIRNGGGEGKVKEVCPPLRVNTETLLKSGDVDCAWVYRTWEVLRAEAEGVALREFRPAECGVPFAYMNTVCVTRALVEDRAGQDLVQRFLRAAGKGAEWAAVRPEEASALMARMAGEELLSRDLADAAFNEKSLRLFAQLGALCPKKDGGGGFSAGEWGRMDVRRWADFVAWSFSPGQVETLGAGDVTSDSALNLTRLFTNEWLPVEGQEEGGAGGKGGAGGGQKRGREEDGESSLAGEGELEGVGAGPGKKATDE